MPAITALLHTENDALRLGRALEMLYPCDDIVIIDHSSQDDTVDLAREYGARVVEAETGISLEQHLQQIRHDWILCLDPRESVTESLAATLFEWKSQPTQPSTPFSIRIREETTTSWIAHPTPQTRLVPANWTHWHGKFPATDSSAVLLEGELLRFTFP
jgi:hypothetical protein